MPARRDERERFWEKVNKSGPQHEGRKVDGRCWLWTASTDRHGYGVFGLATGKTRRAHIVAYEWERGPMPPGLELDHLCRMPSCIRPSHLEAVTHRENAARGMTGRWDRGGSCRRGHPFSSDNTYWVQFTEHGRLRTKRVCAICNGRRCSEYQARKRKKTEEGSSTYKISKHF